MYVCTYKRRCAYNYCFVFCSSLNVLKSESSRNCSSTGRKRKRTAGKIEFRSEPLWTVYGPQLNFINTVLLAVRREDTGFAEESSHLDTIEEQSLVSELCHVAIPYPFYFISLRFNDHLSKLFFLSFFLYACVCV